MQRVIRSEFCGRTLIVVAHKLYTVMEFDHVVLLDHGKVIEYGNPRELLETSASSFHALYMSLQKKEAETAETTESE
jgi:ABC-type multidrug transport system fused ATPase/permease subunit